MMIDEENEGDFIKNIKEVNSNFNEIRCLMNFMENNLNSPINTKEDKIIHLKNAVAAAVLKKFYNRFLREMESIMDMDPEDYKN